MISLASLLSRLWLVLPLQGRLLQHLHRQHLPLLLLLFQILVSAVELVELQLVVPLVVVLVLVELLLLLSRLLHLQQHLLPCLLLLHLRLPLCLRHHPQLVFALLLEPVEPVEQLLELLVLQLVGLLVVLLVGRLLVRLRHLVVELLVLELLVYLVVSQ